MSLLNKDEKIISVNGTLSEEWEDKQQTCDINIYSNGIEIYNSKSNNKEKSLEYEFNNIIQLKIDCRIEEKKKFLFTSKVVYLKIYIDNTDVNKELKIIPSIIIGEGDYNRILKKIEDYKKLIKEREAVEKRNREKIIQEQAFKNEFIKYYDSLQHFFFQAKMDSDGMQRNVESVSNNSSIFLYLVTDMYEKIENTKSINQAMISITGLSYIKPLLYKTVKFIPVTNSGKLIPEANLRKTYEDIVNMLTTNIDTYIKDKLVNGNIQASFITAMLNNIQDNKKDFDLIKIFCFTGMCLTALAFIKCLIICRNQQSFVNNEELYKMFSNLSNEVGVNTKYIAEKLFPLYLNYYKNTFDKEYNIIEFFSLITFYNNHHINTHDVFKIIYDEEINTFKNAITKKPEEFFKSEYNVLFTKVAYFLNEIDSRKYFEFIEKDYNINDKSFDFIFVMFYNNLLKYLGESVPSEVFLKLIDEDYWKNVRMLNSRHENEVMQKEKERLLSGNMEKEKQLKIDKYSFDNIVTGYEFEEYLKVIFERMGNDVQLTKKSNDQGGDLIVEKGGVRTVVQAKFYSSPVGNKAVQEVVAAVSFYKAHKGMIVTNSTYTPSAVALAEVNDVTLIDGEELIKIRNAIIETA